MSSTVPGLTSNSTDIARNLEAVSARIARAAERSGRTPGDVTLVAVSKTVPVAQIRKAIAAGVIHLGENRVQEAKAKFAPRGTPVEVKVGREGITLHMIGALQRNKARQAAWLFDSVQSVDRPELAAALDSARAGLRPQGAPLPVLVEVNVSGEASKSGVAPGDLPRLLDALAGCEHLRGAGLMTVARLGADEAELRQTFGRLRQALEEIRRDYGSEWKHLSMGMTDDFEIAIEEGATMVRIGRAIFGARG